VDSSNFVGQLLCCVLIKVARLSRSSCMVDGVVAVVMVDGVDALREST
jgi:hypothetical protein